jgi:excisionase family DNA binding protein
MIEERLPDWVSVTEAATSLGLTRQRVGKLVASGALRGRRAGNQILIRRADVDARLDLHPTGGRPYSPRRAWALILLASGIVPPGLDYATLSKLRSVVRQQTLWSIRSRLVLRAERRELRAHTSDLPRLEAEDGIIRTGARYARQAGLGLIASDAPVEFYLDASTANRIQKRYRLRASDSPNVILHVIPDEVRGWLTEPVAPRPAVALDLGDDDDPRSRKVAREALSTL